MKKRVKRVLLCAGVLLAIALAVLAMLWFSTEPQLHREVFAAEEAIAAGAACDLSGAEWVLADVPDGELAPMLQTLAERMIREGRSPAPVAILAGNLAHQGRMTNADAAAVVMLALAECPVSAKWPDAYQEALPDMLALLSPEELVAVLSAAEFAAYDTRMQTMLGDQAGSQLTLEQIAQVYRARSKAGLAGDLLVKRALAPFTQEAVIEAMASQTDGELRAALARGYGKTLSLPDDVLTYLAQARAVGVSAAECYPGGAVISMDVSTLKNTRLGWMKGDSPRYIVVRVTESGEKLEYRDVPPELSMDEWVYEGSFSPSYESNRGREAETITVRIDTTLMDATPEEFLPSDLSELDALVVLDTHYEGWGVLRVQEYSLKNASGGRAVNSCRDYRTYATVQRVAVYDAKGWLVYRFAEQVKEPTALELRTDGYSDTVTDAELRASCIPAPDYIWMQERKNELEALLDSCGGDLWQAIEQHGKE